MFNSCRCDCGQCQQFCAAGLGPGYLGRFWDVIRLDSRVYPESGNLNRAKFSLTILSLPARQIWAIIEPNSFGYLACTLMSVTSVKFKENKLVTKAWDTLDYFQILTDFKTVLGDHRLKGRGGTKSLLCKSQVSLKSLPSSPESSRVKDEASPESSQKSKPTSLKSSPKSYHFSFESFQVLLPQK